MFNLFRWRQAKDLILQEALRVKTQELESEKRVVEGLTIQVETLGRKCQERQEEVAKLVDENDKLKAREEKLKSFCTDLKAVVDRFTTDINAVLENYPKEETE